MPLIISVPDGINGRCEHPVELLSIYPTLIDLCGLRNSKLEGGPAPLLKNPESNGSMLRFQPLDRAIMPSAINVGVTSDMRTERKNFTIIRMTPTNGRT